MRRVSAISDYLESARKGKMEGASEKKGREGGEERGKKRNKESEL